VNVKNRLSFFLVAFLIIGFFFLALPEKGFSGVAPPPTMGPIAATDIPTLSGWGLISLAVVLAIVGIVGFMVMRRKKAAS